MKNFKKQFIMVFALALLAGTFLVPVTVQAKTKTTTYQYDKKNGVYCKTAARVAVNQRYETMNIYLAQKGDYVASVKTNSPQLIAKTTSVYTTKTENHTYVEENTSVSYYNRSEITFLAKAKGTYTATVTIKDQKGKKKCTKKIKIYATNDSYPFAYVQYGKQYINYGTYSSNTTSKKSGKLSVKANPTFKLKSVEVCKFVDNDTLKVVKKNANHKTLKLNTTTAYSYNYKDYEGASYSYDVNVTYMNPVTPVRVVVYDTLLKTTQTYEFYIAYVK